MSFSLRPTPPFRLDLTAWALRRRARNIVDRWDGSLYRRVLVIGGAPVEVTATQLGSIDHPRLNATLKARHVTQQTRDAIAELLAHMLGLRIDLSDFYALAATDKRLGPLVSQFRGLKPPRFPTAFEALVNAIACQQLSLTVGIELLNRLAMRCGLAIRSSSSERHAFPRAQDLLSLKAQTFRHLGFSYSKARSLLALSRAITEGRFNPEQLQDLDNESAVEQLMNLRGVGRWTAEYALLRGLGRINMFPGDDVGARNRLAAWLGREDPLDYDGVKRVVRRWQPYAGFVYFHLLLAGLTESGEMPQGGARQLSA